MVDVVNVQNNEQNYVFLVKIVNIMKQYTNKEQTQHLIKLGFPRPKSNVDILGKYYIEAFAYSIGELIEFLPKKEWAIYAPIEHVEMFYEVSVDELECGKYRIELIDALYDACVELKEQGVI